MKKKMTALFLGITLTLSLAAWPEGQRFSSGVGTSDVQKWVSSLGLE